MKMFIRNALLGAAGLVALSLPAHAFGSATVADTPLFKSKTTQQQLAQRPYDPSAGSVGFKHARPYDASAGSVGFKKSQTAQRRDDPSAGSVGFKKSKKKKAKK